MRDQKTRRRYFIVVAKQGGGHLAELAIKAAASLLCPEVEPVLEAVIEVGKIGLQIGGNARLREEVRHRWRGLRSTASEDDDAEKG